MATIRDRHAGTRVAERELTARLRNVLGGGDPVVVWTDCGDEVAVLAGEAVVRRDGDALLAEIPLETDQTGRQVLVVPLLAVGEKVLTSGRPWGHERLADRWGEQLQDVTIAAIGDALTQAKEKQEPR